MPPHSQIHPLAQVHLLEIAERVERLRQLPYFAEADPAQLESLAESACELMLPRGAIIFRRGDVPKGFFLLLKGQVKLFITSERGDEKVVEVVGPGATFGEAVMFLERECIVSTQTLLDSHILFLPKPSVERELLGSTELAKRTLAGLSLKLRKLLGDIESYSLSSGRERLIGYLLSLAECEDEADCHKVTLPVTKALVASRLNVTQEHLSRILHQLVADGLIEVHANTIELRDVRRLQNS